MKTLNRQSSIVNRQSPLFSRSGQIALGFLALMAFMLFLVRLTVKLGEMAQVRTETSNAADAGALAAASWIASGENEAAMVARKMLDAIAMVQAIYLVPFCPGAASTAYANSLWTSLATAPRGGQGPNAYFADVANAAMYDAWNVAHREALTAMLNNMMMRYNTGPTAPGVIFGSLPTDIRSAQQQMYDPVPNYGEGGLWWNNGLPLDDPNSLTHKPEYVLQSSQFYAPSLQMVTAPATYYQYVNNAWIGPYFHCDFTGAGITTTNGPVADLARVTLPSNPLAVVDATGLKGWDIDLRPIIPGINHEIPAMRIAVGNCPHTCGMVPRQTPYRRVSPAQILNGDGRITVTVSHEVLTSGGIGYDFGFGHYIWNTRFPKVASRAVAHYTPAQVAGAFGVARPNASASLDQTQ